MTEHPGESGNENNDSSTAKAVTYLDGENVCEVYVCVCE